jgi:hypothetical protein
MCIAFLETEIYWNSRLCSCRWGNSLFRIECTYKFLVGSFIPNSDCRVGPNSICSWKSTPLLVKYIFSFLSFFLFIWPSCQSRDKDMFQLLFLFTFITTKYFATSKDSVRNILRLCYTKYKIGHHIFDHSITWLFYLIYFRKQQSIDFNNIFKCCSWANFDFQVVSRSTFGAKYFLHQTIFILSSWRDAIEVCLGV